jgi:hypothetical protein
MSNLVPTTIVDKNGKTTTVHKKSEQASSARSASSVPVAATTAPTALTGTMRAPEKTTLVRSLSVGDKVEMGFGKDYTSELANQYPSEEARAFEYIRDAGVTGELEYLGVEFSEKADRDGSRWEHHQYEVTLTNESGNTMSVPFSSGMGIEEAPDISTVLGSVTSDAAMFENDEIPEEEEDYDEDDYGDDDDAPRSSAGIHAAVQEQTENLQMFIGDTAEYERLIWGE